MSHGIPETGPVVWTTLGIERQYRVVETARAAFYAHIRAEDAHQHGEHLQSEDQLLEGAHEQTERGRLYSTWKNAEVLMGRLQPVPKRLSTKLGCTGLVVKIQHLDDEMITKRGETEIFVLGGLGEADTDGKLRVYSVDSPLGRAVKGKEVGDTVTVRTPADGFYDVEILSFETLTAFLERLPTSMDGLDAAHLELGFGVSPA